MKTMAFAKRDFVRQKAKKHRHAVLFVELVDSTRYFFEHFQTDFAFSNFTQGCYGWFVFAVDFSGMTLA